MKFTFKFKYLAISAVSLNAALFLPSCTRKQTPISFNEIPVKTHLSPTEQTSLLATIKNRGVQVITQGSRIQFVLFRNKFFVATTQNIKSTEFDTLKLISLYIHNYAHSHLINYPIKVYGYTGTTYNRDTRMEKSRQYAQVVASFMWNYGFSPQQLSVVGHGAKHPIAENQTSVGNGFNNRTVIQVN